MSLDLHHQLEQPGTDLHSRLLAATSALTVAQERTPEELAAVLLAVLKLHAPKDRGAGPTCAGCEIRGVGFVWIEKCRTLQAIAEHLGEVGNAA